MILNGVDVGYDLGQFRAPFFTEDCKVCDEPATHVHVFWVPPYGRSVSEVLTVELCDVHAAHLRYVVRGRRAR